MVRRPVLAMFAVIAMVLGGVVVSTPAGAVADSVVVVASPSPGTGSNNLSSVSCVSSSFCVAVGNYNNGSAGQTLVEVWDGADWTVMASPSPGTGSNNLSSVSCVSASFCVAVGNYNNGSAGQTLVVSLTDPEPVPNTTTLPPSTTTTLSSPGKVVPAFTG